MLDLNHLTTPTTGRTDYFYGKSTTLGGSWEIWEKPRGINMIHITCIGDGGGGGGGATQNSSTARAGGAGGSSGGFTTLSIPAIYLPDRLYVSVGKGGVGGAPGNPASLGIAGVGSYVTIAPYSGSIVPIYTVCYANGGTVSTVQPTNTVTSTAPTATAVATITNMLIAGLGNFSALAGQAGGVGGAANGVGGALAYPTTGLLLSGGAGGGGGSQAGGAITAPTQASYVYFSSLLGGSAGTASPGASGYRIEQPLISLGASGASAPTANNATGGDGRPGGIGSGGSGGSGGNPGGTGGDGGPGLVIIQSW